MNKIIFHIGSLNFTLHSLFVILFVISLVSCFIAGRKKREVYDKLRSIQVKYQLPAVLLFALLAVFNISNNSIYPLFTYLMYLCAVIPNIIVFIVLICN